MSYEKMPAYACEGSCALELDEGPRLRVYEGSLATRPREAEGRRRGSWLVAVALVVVAALVALGVCAADNQRASRSSAAFDAAPEETVSVTPGDSLWSIAERRTPAGGDTAALVRWLRERNGLRDSTLRAGESLVVPVLG